MKNEVLDILVDVCGDSVVKEEMELNLFDSGLLDSLGMIELLVQFEEKIGIVIEPTEVEREEIDTPSKLVNYIEMRK